jgi:surface polysaccharide O-acyltransferase-like enzyme
MSRRADIEILRLVACFLIVCYHSGADGHRYAYSGLIIFIIISMLFLGNTRHPFKTEIKTKAEKIIMPWLFWLVAYGAFNILTNRPIFDGSGNIFEKILSGTSIHLWFMPFLFLSHAGINILKRMASSQTVSYFSILFASLCLISAGMWRTPSLHWATPWPQYAQAFSAIFIGIFFSTINDISKTGRIAATAIQIPGIGISYLIGIIFGFLLKLSPFREKEASTNLRTFSNLTLGIYFIHILVFAFILKVNQNIGGNMLGVLSFIVAAAIVYISKKAFPSFSKNWCQMIFSHGDCVIYQFI